MAVLRYGVKPFDMRETQRQLTKALRAKHGSLEEVAHILP